MKRIDLLNFGSLILNDDHLALPVTSYVLNTWESGIAKTINTAIFMTQLLESRKNNTDVSNYKFDADEEKIYSVILKQISKIELSEKMSLSEYLLIRLKKQLTEWLSQWPTVSEEFPAKIKFQQLLSILLNSQNILDESFPNYLLANPAPILLESMFGMLRTEMVIQSAITRSQKQLDVHCELIKLLEIARDSTLYNSNPYLMLTLKQIAKTNSKWTGHFTEWALGVPDVLITLVEANQNPVFNSLVREQFLAAESKIVREENLLIGELAQEIKQHQDKIRQRFVTHQFGLDEYLRVSAEYMQKLLKYQSSLSSSAAVTFAFIKTFLNFHGKNFPTWGEFSQKPRQENKTVVSPNLSDKKPPVIPTIMNKPRPPQTPKGISVIPSLSSSSSSDSSSGSNLSTSNFTSVPESTYTVTESLNSPLMISASLSTSISVSGITTESPKIPEAPQSAEIFTESKKPDTEVLVNDINNPLRGNAQVVAASIVQSETIGVSTTPSKDPALEKSPSSVKIAPISQGSSFAKKASIFQQPLSSSASSDSSTMGSTSSTRKESKVLNPKFEALRKAVIIPGMPSTPTQTLIQTTKNKGFIGSGTTGNTTITSSSNSTLTTGQV